MATPVEDWLRQIEENTRRTRDAAEGRGRGAGGGSGAAGGVAAHQFDRLIARLEGAVIGGIAGRLGQARGLANRGFGNTVESAKLDYAMEQLGRQFAAVMSPVISAMTYGATEIEKRMRMMGGNEQNRLLGAGIGAMLGLRFGPLGALAGAGLGSILMGGRDPYQRHNSSDVFTGMAAGAYAGWRVGGPVGAFVGGVAGGIAGAPAHRPGERPFDYYDRLRSEGASRLSAGFSTAFRAAGRFVGAVDDAGAAIGGGRRPDDRRRDVTVYNPDMKEVGGTAFDIQKLVTRATAGDGAEEDGGPLKPVMDVLIAIFDLLSGALGGGGGGGALAPAGARRAGG